MNVTEIFTATANMFEADHEAWVQHTYAIGGFCFCLIGGLAHVSDRTITKVEDDPDLIEPLARAAGVEPTAGDIIDWNDQLGRTVAEVIAVLREAAK